MRGNNARKFTLCTGKVVSAYWTYGVNGIEEYGCDTEQEWNSLTDTEHCDLFRQIQAVEATSYAEWWVELVEATGG